MAGIKGPAVFLAQFLRDTPPFNSLENICKWFAELGAREGAPFIRRHLIEPTTVAFDDFAGAGSDAEANRAMLGLA